MALQKRTIRLAGHNTSVALESEFWRALERLASQRGLTLAQLVAEVDSGRTSAGLASALRVMALKNASPPLQ
ncbi:MAG: ribbon-helix-helix domain-containing protein [Alphaproteobacteria bacterium]